MHVHAFCAHGEAKFWLEPGIQLAYNYGLTEKDLRTAQELIEAHQDEIRRAWRKHFGG